MRAIVISNEVWVTMKKAVLGLVLSSLVLTSLSGCNDDSSSNTPELNSKALLGGKLYSDKNLSLNRTQSCATCHNPEHGFIDERTNDASRDTGHGLVASAGSLGDNGTSIGDRNAPTAAYAAFSPEFHQGSRQRPIVLARFGDYQGFLGGQFWDGREADLKGQAGGPPTNPDEMAMPDKASVIERLLEDAAYVAGFEYVYGADIFNNVENAYAAMAESIGEFEKNEEFATFDSKYDRSLLDSNDANYFDFGLISKVETGRVLFFSSDFTCAACHQSIPRAGVPREVFTSFEYHNIGVPENTALRLINGATGPDLGLLNNPEVNAETEKGKFKAPTLRNAAVSAPYMHNGIFNELETVIDFYQHVKERSINLDNGSAINLVNNPETDLPWGAAEVSENISHTLLKGSINIQPVHKEALVCFIMSLTDARYEHLLDSAKVSACGL